MKSCDKKRSQPKKQKGYILLFVSVFVLALMAAAAAFFGRSSQDVQTSVQARDSVTAAQLAESAMNRVVGDFVSGALDVNADGIPDSTNISKIIQAHSSSADLATAIKTVPYAYVVSAGKGIDSATPSILQAVANGESAASSATATATGILSARTVAANLRIESLFGTVTKPLVYGLDATAMLVQLNPASYAEATSTDRAFVWIELVANATSATAVDVFVEVAAVSGEAKRYVQRYAATMSTLSNLGSGAGLIWEHSNVKR